MINTVPLDMDNTVVSKIFTGCNFREFRYKGRVRENLFTEFNTGGYKMAAIVSKTNFRLFVIKIDNNP